VRLKIALSLLLLLPVATDHAWGIDAGHTTFGIGPGGASVKAEWAVAIKGSFDYRCDFDGGSKKAIVLYRLAGKEWTALSTCHAGGGPTTFGHMPPSAAGARFAVTGWYGEGNAWKQCDLNGWKKNVDGSYLSCKSPDGGWLMFTCAKSLCRKP